jgi:hypothetical protein
MHGLGLSLWTGEDVPELTTTTKIPAKTPKMVSLEIGDENWVKVMKYISANKSLGLAKIISNLGAKYSIKASVKKEIEKAM